MNEKKVDFSKISTLDMTKKALKVGCKAVVEEYLGHEIHPEKEYIDMVQYIYLSAICVNAATTLYFIELDKSDAKAAKLVNIAFAEDMVNIGNMLKDNYIMGKDLNFDTDKFDAAVSILLKFLDDLFRILRESLKIALYIGDSQECVEKLPIHSQYVDMVDQFVKYYKIFKIIETDVKDSDMRH